MTSASGAFTRHAPVDVGLHVLGVGNGGRPDVMAAVARGADGLGFATLWCGEHVVMVDEPESHYPYSDDGKIAVPSDADWLDPLLGLSYLAACTNKVRLATGILLLPEHNPVVVAKKAATLDVLSEGRFALGIGVGWAAEEFAALGVPFDGRGARTDDYVAAMRRLWTDEVVSYDGEFVRFDSVRMHPKPTRRTIPVIVGGTGDAALRRVARLGDGWYGFNLPAAAVPDRVKVLGEECRRLGRDPRDLTIAVSLSDGHPEMLPDLAAAGVTEVVLVAEPPGEPPDAAEWVRELAARWLSGSEFCGP